MAAYDDVLADLRALRHSKAQVPIDFKNSPHLVWHLGRGNIDVAALFLKALERSGDRAILAALASIGMSGHASSNVEDRMNFFAAEYDETSTRTVRRWADEGFERIARLVVEWSEEEGNDQPRVEILLTQQDDAIRLVLTYFGWQQMSMLEPTLEVDQQRVAMEVLGSDVSDHQWRLRTSYVAPLSKGLTVAATFRIDWLGNAATYYEVQVHPSIRGYVITSVATKKGCEIRIIDVDKFKT